MWNDPGADDNGGLCSTSDGSLICLGIQRDAVCTVQITDSVSSVFLLSDGSVFEPYGKRGNRQMERSIHIWQYGGCQFAGTLSAGERIEGAELSADPVRKRGTVLLLPDLSEMETPVPAFGSGAGLPGVD